MRSAYAHRSWTYDVDGITTDLKAGRRHYSLDEVLDQCLLGVESTLACLLAITVTLASVGVAEDDPTLTDLGLSTTDTVDLMLAAFGYQSESTRIHEGTLQLSITTRRSDLALTTVLSGVLCTQADLGMIERVSVTLPGSDEPWTCDAKAFQEFRLAEDEFDKQLALLRIQSAWRHAGRPNLTSHALRKWAVVSAIDALDLPPREGLRRVRQLRHLAREQQDNELEAVLRRLTQHARLRLMGEADQIEADVLAVLAKWNTDTRFDIV